MIARLVALVQRTFAWLGGHGWIALLACRLSMAGEFIPSGWGKLGNLAKLTAYFETLHIPAPGINAAASATTELVGGLLLLVGLGTRFASVALTVVMMVAILTARLQDAHTIGDFFYLPEPAYIVIFLVLIFHGPGRVSLDRVIAERRKKA
jgi:putative oxidoreductase